MTLPFIWNASVAWKVSVKMDCRAWERVKETEGPHRFRRESTYTAIKVPGDHLTIRFTTYNVPTKSFTWN